MAESPQVHIDPNEPFADGILFDDLHGLTIEHRNRLAARGVVFLTNFEANGLAYCGTIVSTAWAGAEEIAFSRGLGETVVGVLAETIEASDGN